MITLENARLKIGFSEENGAIVALTDKSKQIQYVQENKPAEPFRLECNGELSAGFAQFSYERDASGTGLRLAWQVNALIRVTGRVALPAGGEQAVFDASVVNLSDEAIPALEYPIIPNLRHITPNGADDYLAHSFATGFLIRNPLAQFPEDGSGLRFMPYPEGFSGATMQFFTFYGKGEGGLYFAAYDSEHYCKWMNFYRHGDALEASFIHGYEDIGPGKGVEQAYPVVVKLLQEGSWYEAAETYKAWAVGQKWTRQGSLSDMSDADKAKWLLEDTGLATFGINAGCERTRWIEAYHRLTDTNVFHVTGPDWPQSGQNYFNHVPGGVADWFPARFDPHNLETMKRLGDRFAPFEFDYLFNFKGADSEQGLKARHQMPAKPLSIDKYHFSFVCPQAPYIQELHKQRDERLVRETPADAVYYDISANNILKVCMDPQHGHPVGAGREITGAYRDNYRETKTAMRQAAGKYVPMGTEMINEVFLDVLDFYQARAGAQPATDFEGWNIRELIKSGAAELIPLFAYVYHEYGPVRLDGWGNLTREIGNLFYYTVARSYLWGGLYELNYEYSPMEAIDGQENSPDEHYYRFEPRHYALVPERGEYIRQFARLRTGGGNRYLAYGTMQRPLLFACKTVPLDWFHYNSDLRTKAYNDGGVLRKEAVVHSAWSFKQESLGFFFANITDEEMSIRIVLDMSKYRLEQKPYAADWLAAPDITAARLLELGASETVQIELTVLPMTVAMLEVH